ncbi:unnamed protein product [Cladocopium goreaui]|uniref:UBA domain-containing protein n=1 Tax=Cladocopium goreaui TaxID=2562237 RepID=A0A9P1FH46_9DINO|nr:unnamed protein product [Cladocopium goreaui]
MKRLQSLLRRLERFPHTLVPKSILRLIESLNGASSSWGPGRALENWVHGQPWRKALPLPFQIEVPIFYEDARGQQRTSGMHYVLLPHEILGTFYQFEAADLMMKLTGGPGALAEFWSHEQTTEWFRNHPILRVTDPNFVIPFRLFGDGAESSRKQKFEILTLVLPVVSHANRSSATMDTRILISCMSGTYCNHYSRTRILETIAWSFEALSTGKYPRCDPWGRPFTAQYHPHRMRLAGKRIAGNYVGVLEAFQGDQDFIRILFSPSRFFSRQFCCYYCRACQWVYQDDNPQLNDYLYTNFGPAAAHRNTLVTISEWADVNPETPLMRIPGWSPWRILPDIMHICYLACTVDVITSFELVRRWDWRRLKWCAYVVAEFFHPQNGHILSLGTWCTGLV